MYYKSCYSLVHSMEREKSEQQHRIREESQNSQSRQHHVLQSSFDSKVHVTVYMNMHVTALHVFFTCSSYKPLSMILSVRGLNWSKDIVQN